MSRASWKFGTSSTTGESGDAPITQVWRIVAPFPVIVSAWPSGVWSRSVRSQPRPRRSQDTWSGHRLPLPGARSQNHRRRHDTIGVTPPPTTGTATPGAPRRVPRCAREKSTRRSRGGSGVTSGESAARVDQARPTRSSCGALLPRVRTHDDGHGSGGSRQTAPLSHVVRIRGRRRRRTRSLAAALASPRQRSAGSTSGISNALAFRSRIRQPRWHSRETLPRRCRPRSGSCPHSLTRSISSPSTGRR